MKFATLGLIGALAAGLAVFTPPAKAQVTILTFSQDGTGLTIAGTASATGTVWGGTDIPVTISGIAAPLGTPLSAFLDVSAQSTAGALNPAGNLVIQTYSGTFSFNSAADGSGTNFLAGSFSDGAITALGASGIGIFSADGLFTSDVITTLGDPLSLQFGLSGVIPVVSLFACPAVNPGCSGSGQTIASFQASIAGDASASPVPEPATIALFGASLLGLGLMGRRRKLAA